MATDSRGYALGLFITTEAIFATQLRVARGGVEVAARGSVETPEAAFEGASIIDPPRVANAIRVLLRQMGINRARTASVALQAPGYSLRTLRLPDSPLAERRTLVRGELEQVGALPIGNGAFDFLWVPAPTVEGRRQADAYAYYAADAEVDSVRETLRLAGLQLDTIEPASLAQMRAYLDRPTEIDPVVLLAPAAKHTDLCIHDGHQVRHLRRIPAGMADFQVTPSAASPFGAEGGPMEEFVLPGAAETPDPGPVGPLGISTAPAVDLPDERESVGMGLQQSPSVAFVVGEVVRTLAFYSREYPDAAAPQRIVVIGSDTVAGAMRERLRGAIALPVDDGPLLEGYDLPEPVVRHRMPDDTGGFLCTLGATLGGANAETALPLVDISQQEQAARMRRRAPGVLLVGMAGSTLWMLAAVTLSIALFFMEDQARSESSALAAQITQIKEERARRMKLLEVFQSAQAARARSEVPAAAVLGRAAASTTPGVAVTSIKAGADGKVTIDGEALTTGAMQEFALALNRGRTTRWPIFRKFTRGPEGRLTFSLESTFRAGVE